MKVNIHMQNRSGTREWRGRGECSWGRKYRFSVIPAEAEIQCSFLPYFCNQKYQLCIGSYQAHSSPDNLQKSSSFVRSFCILFPTCFLKFQTREHSEFWRKLHRQNIKTHKNKKQKKITDIQNSI
jgi:hypothetical protein